MVPVELRVRRVLLQLLEQQRVALHPPLRLLRLGDQPVHLGVGFRVQGLGLRV